MFRPRPQDEELLPPDIGGTDGTADILRWHRDRLWRRLLHKYVDTTLRGNTVSVPL